MSVRVYLHTNRPPEQSHRPPPASSSSSYTAIHGWSRQNVSGLQERFDCCYRAPWNLHSVFKYKWLLDEVRRGTNHGGVDGAPVVLADNDVLIQCPATELLEKFHAFQKPLVVGGERTWFPIPDRAHDPFGPLASLPWKARYQSRHRNQFYPNSGLLMGTVIGFRKLWRAMQERNTRSFPCCAYEGETGGFKLDPCTSCVPKRTFENRSMCVVDDQACLSVALAASTRHGPTSSAPPPHAIDVFSKLFLNLGDLNPNDLAIRDGRLAFKHSAHVPCIVHSNGYKGTLQRLAPLLNASRISWFVQPPLPPHVAQSTTRSEWLREGLHIEGMRPRPRAAGARAARNNLAWYKG